MESRLSVIIFFFLLLVRFADQSFFNWAFNSEIPDWFKYFYSSTIYTVVTVVIWLNRKRLSDLHVDKSFLQIFLFTGVILFLWYLPIYIGFLILILMGFIIWGSKNAKFNYQNFHIAPKRLIFYILITLIPVVPTILYMFFGKIDVIIDRNSMFDALLESNVIGVIMEEMLFRGLLWMLLIDLSISEGKIIYIQMFLFWISHYHLLMSNGLYSFWVSLPFVGIVYGMIVRREKSITPTIICHFTYNFVVAVISQSLGNL